MPVDPATCRAVPAAVAEALDERAALVVVSAPSYPHGVLDPVGEIAALAADAGVPCHVDACIGGWILPFLDDVPEPFDLSVPGVTSLSVDLHKYGYAPKGVSVLLSADAGVPARALVRHGRLARLPGGQPDAGRHPAGRADGGRLGGAPVARRRRVPRAGAADPCGDGRAGRRVAAAVDGLRVVGSPVATLVALAQDGPDGVDVLNLADEMTARGWLLQPQPPFAQSGGDLPATLHLTVTGATAGGSTPCSPTSPPPPARPPRSPGPSPTPISWPPPRRSTRPR